MVHIGQDCDHRRSRVDSMVTMFSISVIILEFDLL